MINKLKIGHQVVDIKITNILREGRMGEFSPMDGYIAIDETIVSKPGEFLSTLLHEITHALAWHMGVLSDSLEPERICDLVGNGMTMVFMDNPELMKEINKQLRKI